MNIKAVKEGTIFIIYNILYIINIYIYIYLYLGYFNMAICNTYLKDYRVALKNIDEFLEKD